MASNSGTGLTDGNGKRNQLHRATIVFTNLKTRCRPMWNCFSNVQTDITSTFSSSLSSTITTPATSDDISFGDASSPKVRIDDAMSPNSQQTRKRYNRDALVWFSDKRQLNVKCPLIDERRLFLRTKLTVFSTKVNVLTFPHENTFWHVVSYNVRTASERGGYSSRPYMQFPVPAGVGRAAGRGSGGGLRAARKNEVKL